eukprot:2864104-Prymnesium_polylepis.1
MDAAPEKKKVAETFWSTQTPRPGRRPLALSTRTPRAPAGPPPPPLLSCCPTLRRPAAPPYHVCQDPAERIWAMFGPGDGKYLVCGGLCALASGAIQGSLGALIVKTIFSLQARTQPSTLLPVAQTSLCTHTLRAAFTHCGPPHAARSAHASGTTARAPPLRVRHHCTCATTVRAPPLRVRHHCACATTVRAPPLYVRDHCTCATTVRAPPLYVRHH